MANDKSELKEIITNDTMSSVGATSDKVERIRDIIFGTQMRIYQRTFDALHQDIKRLRADLANMSAQMQSQAETFEDKLSEQGRQLVDQLHNQQSEHTSQVKEVDQRYSKQLNKLAVKQEKDVNELNQQVLSVEHSLRTELARALERIGEEKADRDGLGNLLIELGSTLKSNVSQPLLDDLLAQLNSES